MRLKLLAISMLILSACSNNYSKSSVENRYNKLSKNLDILMSDTIQEKKRAKLESDFNKFSFGMKKFKEKNSEEDTTYLDKYIYSSDVKIQYLRDLKD